MTQVTWATLSFRSEQDAAANPGVGGPGWPVFPASSGASGSLDGGRHLRVPPLLLVCARAHSHGCALAALTHARMLARSYVNTCAHMTRPHNAPTHTIMHRPHAAWLPSVAAGASQSLKEGLPFLKLQSTVHS